MCVLRLHQRHAVRSIACFSLLPFFFISVTGCHRSEENASTANQTPIAPVAIATRAPLTNTLHVAGEFLPMQEVELHAKVAGYIRKISVDIGDKVRTGQVLATLDVPELAAQVQGADAGVRQTQEQITRAKSDVLRAQANLDALHANAQRLKQASDARPGLIAQQELEDAEARDREAAAQLDASKAGLSATQQQLGISQASQQQTSAMAGYSRIVAPFSGVVTWRYADTGALIQAGTSNVASEPVVKVAEVSTLRLRLPVPESLAPFVNVGDTAQVKVQALNTAFSGKIVRKTDALDPTTRTEQVEIDVPNADGKLAPGMYADVSLPIARSGDALTVPVQAVNQTDQNGTRPYVLIVNSANKVERRNVQLGVSTANRIEIVSGLQPGEKVISANLSAYQPGELVAPRVSAMATSEEAQ